MDNGTSITSAILHVTMIKAAQLQEQLALKLIESATQSINSAQTPPETPGVKGGDAGEEHTVDIRV